MPDATERAQRRFATPSLADAVCVLLCLVFALSTWIFAVEAWRYHQSGFSRLAVPHAVLGACLAGYLATRRLAFLWALTAFWTSTAVLQEVQVRHVHPLHAAMSVAALAASLLLSYKAWVGPGRLGKWSAATVAAALACSLAVGVHHFGGEAFVSPASGRWREAPGERQAIVAAHASWKRVATGRSWNVVTATFRVDMQGDPHRLGQRSLDIMARETFCRKNAGADEDGRATVVLSFVDAAGAPIGSSVLTAERCGEG